ncbi:alpha/beta hydrolase [Kordiimonas marina]|uniref:alpha/beta hydrolase n=1 Tax=Kordiimonas marina TaxID=2872312 RepID=UPI001FF591E3|nr:alpha/beta hydrolase [Kordiimonas marina]MCJ9427785.1 alpha/beta hydrolase [Kordiimonas marina]
MALAFEVAINRFGMRLHSFLVWRGRKTPLKTIRNLKVPGAAGSLPARLYTPEGEGPFPLAVFFHGGGFCLGSLETHDALCRDLCVAAGAAVLSVAYRLAPAHPYPAAPDDAYAATCWAAGAAEVLGVRPGPFFVAGDSAGGCLATVVARRARDEAGPKLAGQILIFPKVDMVGPVTESYRQNIGTSIISEKFVTMFEGAYVPDRRRAGEPDASPMQAGTLKGLPPALVQTAELDPLRDEGEAYARRLEAEGVETTLTRYDGVDHAFVGFTGPSKPHKQAVAEIAAWVRQHLA